MNTRSLLLLSAAGSLLLAQTPSPNVTFNRLLAANKEPQNWLTYSGTTMSQRYSLLTQITTDNVQNLEQAWTLKTQTGEKFEETPLVVDGVMYTVVPPPPRGGRGGGGGGRGGRGRGGAAGAPRPERIPRRQDLRHPLPLPLPLPLQLRPASSARTRRLRLRRRPLMWWRSMPPRARLCGPIPTFPRHDAKPCCGRVNRGLAILGGTLYMGTTDAHLIAIDAKTGMLLWNTEVATAKEGYAITHAPLIVKDKVLIGTAGGEYGIRGFVAAYNAATGKEVWRFHNVPEPGEPGNETWAGDSWKHGAASVWTTGSYDPDLNLTYWGTGNAGPDFDGDARAGDNLYCNSVLALDADTGKLKWYYQFSPHDERDWDAAQIPLLADIQWQGQPRKVMMWANRNGVFYVLDRATGKFLLGKAFTTINWLGGFDENGRPKWADGKLPQPGGEQVTLYPGVEGGTSWYSPSFSPRTGFFYVSAWDNYHQSVRKPEKPQAFVEGGVFGGGGGGGSNIGWNGGNVTVRKEEDGFGAVRAVDPQTGNKKWEYKMTDITMAGILTTATDVLFSGAHNGNFFALDARTGAELWKTSLAGAVYSGAMTYSVGGKQYVEVAGGNTMYVFALK